MKSSAIFVAISKNNNFNVTFDNGGNAVISLPPGEISRFKNSNNLFFDNEYDCYRFNDNIIREISFKNLKFIRCDKFGISYYEADSWY